MNKNPYKSAILGSFVAKWTLAIVICVVNGPKSHDFKKHLRLNSLPFHDHPISTNVLPPLSSVEMGHIHTNINYITNLQGNSQASGRNPDFTELFLEWLEVYQAIPPSVDDPQFIERGEQLAKGRRPLLRDLIQNNPVRALEFAVSPSIISTLPKTIQSQMENWVNETGQYSVSIQCIHNDSGDQNQVSREFITQTHMYQAFVGNEYQFLGTQDDTDLIGIALGEDLAIQRIGMTEDQSLVRNQLPQVFTANSSDTISGGGPVFDMPSYQTQGIKRLLFIRVCFPDDPSDPMSASAAAQLMDKVNLIYSRQSYYSTGINAEITPLLMLPQNKVDYANKSVWELKRDARFAAKSAGFDPDLYDLEIIRNTKIQGKQFAFDGQATIGGKGLILQSSLLYVAVHELGHNYGLWHANFWDAMEDSRIGPGRVLEYGDIFDTMGTQKSNPAHYDFNVAFKHQLHWLHSPFVHKVESTETFRLSAFDVGRLQPEKLYALVIKKDAARDYWLSFRQNIQGNPWAESGLILHWSPFNTALGNTLGGTVLIDSTYGNSKLGIYKEDAPLVVGKTFSDHASGIHITPLDVHHSNPGRFMDIQINLGNFINNLSPRLELLSSKIQLHLEESVTLTAVASDPDGDDLAYHWTFGDTTFGANQSLVTKSWDRPGDYVVQCIVSDMKGGKAVSNIKISVENVDLLSVQGRVLSFGEPLQGVRIFTGQNTPHYQESFTDINGDYFLPNLSPGSLKLQAVKFGYDISPLGFANPVQLMDINPQLNWSATPKTTVSIDPVELNPSEIKSGIGKFRVSRTGEIGKTLKVKCELSGNLSYGQDFRCTNIEEADGVYQIVFPSGTRSLDLLITPFHGSYSVNHPSIICTLINDDGYIVGFSAEIELQLYDQDEEILPDVSMQLLDAYAAESGPCGAVLRLTRIPLSKEDLTGTFEISGTAQEGMDFLLPSTSWTIPAGYSYTDIHIEVLDDALVEGEEFILVNIQPQKHFQTVGSGIVKVAIQDDDPPHVSIMATDGDLGESRNHGKFTVTRFGSLKNELKIFYEIKGIAESGNDFLIPTGEVVLPKDIQSASFTLMVKDDAIVEGEEWLDIILLSHESYNVFDPGFVRVVIQDDDLIQLRVDSVENAIDESSDKPANIRFSRQTASPFGIRLCLEFTGEAHEGIDFMVQGTTVSNEKHYVEIPSDSTVANIQLYPVDDQIYENDETIFLNLVVDERSGYTVENDIPILITIHDDDMGKPVGLSFASSQSQALESEFVVDINIHLSGPAPITGAAYSYEVLGGSAKYPIDYVYDAPGIRWIPRNYRTDSFTLLGIINDNIPEKDETVIIRLIPMEGCVLDHINQVHTFHIDDDDTDSGSISVVALSESVFEGTMDEVGFRISRSGNVEEPLEILFQFTGTASSPTDYYHTIGSMISIPEGRSFVDIPIKIQNDQTLEPEETICLNLVHTSDGVIQNKSAIIRIRKNSRVPKIFWEQPPSIIYGLPLGERHLNAVCAVPGVFDYKPPLGTMLQAGLEQELSAHFYPNNSSLYDVVVVYTHIDVLKRSLDLYALDQEKGYGDDWVFDTTFPSQHFKIQGLLEGDEISSVQIFSEGADFLAPIEGSPYRITLDGIQGLGLQNYLPHFNDGQLFIRPKKLDPKFGVTPSPSILENEIRIFWESGIVNDQIEIPTGYVTLHLGDEDEISMPLDYGKMIYQFEPLSAGWYSLIFEYAGDERYLSATNTLSARHLVNTPPYAGNDFVDLISAGVITWPWMDLLLNDFDADGHSVVLEILDEKTDQEGQIRMEGDLLIYTPPTTSISEDLFHYRLRDHHGATNLGEVMLHFWPDDVISEYRKLSFTQDQQGLFFFYHGDPLDSYYVEFINDLSSSTWTSMARFHTDSRGFAVKQCDRFSSRTAFFRVVHSSRKEGIRIR